MSKWRGGNWKGSFHPNTHTVFRPAYGLSTWHTRTPDPVPPGPADRLVPALDGLVSYSTSFNSAAGIIIVRINARNNAASAPGLSATWNGVAMTKVAEVHDGTVGGPVAALFGIRGGATGSRTLAISATGSVGFAAVRIGDLAALAVDWIGDVKSAIVTDSLIDLQVAPQAPGASNLSEQAVWMHDMAYPITQYYGANEQWQTRQYNLAAELAVNGSFTTDTDWQKGTAWTIAGGVATRGVHTAISTQLRQTFASPVANDRYLNAFDITATSGGSVRFMWGMVVGHWPDGYARTQIGHYEQVVTVHAGGGNSATNSYGLRGDADILAPGISVDNFSMKKVLGGMAAYFGQQQSTTPGQYTLEANWEMPSGTKGAALMVELKGAVLP